MIVINIDPKTNTINIYKEKCLFNGGVGSGIKGHTTPKKEESKRDIIIKGNELGSYRDIKELRQKAVDYYKKNLQGKYVENKKLGKILFSRIGLEKFLSSSGQEEKIKSIVALSDIIKNGEYVGEEKLNHPRKDGIVKFHRINKKVTLVDKSKLMSVLIAEDINGNRFYNLNNEIEKDFEFLPQSNEGSSKSYNSIIKYQNLKVNPLNKEFELNLFFK